ncbi:uncharacterized protein LOC121375341 [Gigantopelta aegis]|uniref:uncharacterized protein LOC121375341 n=1 Tax=Gigantopelta aegis TaxID=1735272 RepID=UPI001B88A739|nr:uncharacterized protein LOC121375341 [Gigantopelta aegis]
MIRFSHLFNQLKQDGILPSSQKSNDEKNYDICDEVAIRAEISLRAEQDLAEKPKESAEYDPVGTAPATVGPTPEEKSYQDSDYDGDDHASLSSGSLYKPGSQDIDSTDDSNAGVDQHACDLHAFLYDGISVNNNNAIQPPVAKRPRTDQEKQVRNKKMYPMLAPCGEKCRKQCTQHISTEQRVKIHDEFWTMDYNKRRRWVYFHVKTTKTKRPRKESTGAKPREKTRLYVCPDEKSQETFVCKTFFFLHTLGFRSDKVVTTALSSTPEGAISPMPDARGTHAPKNKLKDEISDAMRDHIRSYNPAISHYRREHAPYRLYQPPTFSINEIFSDFKETPVGREGVCYETYRKEVTKMNISFAKLGEEECEVCLVLEKHAHENDDPAQCSLCKEWRDHVENFRISREMYQADIKMVHPDNEAYFSVDMQKVIMMPRLPGNKTSIFTRRLVLFRETFAPLGKSSKDKPVCGILWHEAISGRNAEDIASARDCTVFVFWADNCTAQNKTWTLFTALTCEVNKQGGPDVVRIKYLEKGHTFMSADSFHARIEMGLRAKRNVYDFDDFCEVVSKFGKALPMEHTDFYKYKNESSSAAFTKKPHLNNVQEVMFKRGSSNIFWKGSLADDTYQDGAFLKKKVARAILGGLEIRPLEVPRGITGAKKNDIVNKLCPFMPQNLEGLDSQ